MAQQTLSPADVAEMIRNDVNLHTSAGNGTDFSEPLPDGDYICSLFDLKVQNSDKEGAEEHINGKMTFQIVEDKEGDRTWKGKVVTKNHKIYNPDVDPSNMKIAVQIFMKKINMLDPEYWNAVENKNATAWLNTEGSKFVDYEQLKNDICPEYLNTYSTFKKDGKMDWGQLYLVNFYTNKAGYPDFKILGLAEMPSDLQ